MITRIEVDGYRLLNGFSADLKPLNVVIGANATGKSTLLDCLQCISQCAEYPLNTVLGWHWGMMSLVNATEKSERKVTWQITFRKPSNGEWAQLPLEEGKPMTYEVTLQSDVRGQAFVQYESLRAKDPLPNYAEPFKYLEATQFRKAIFDRQKHKLVPFDEAVPHTQSVRESGEDAPRDANSLPGHIQEPTLMLSQIRFFNEFPIPSAARFLLAIMAFYPGFDVTRFSVLRTKASEIKPSVILLPNGENLGTVIHEILNRYEFRSSANDLRLFLRTAYPSFEDIFSETTLGAPPQVLVRMREKGMERSTEIWEISDGMLRFLCLATALLNPSPPPFVAIDEPEAGLHPKLLPIVADMIKMASERTQVLVTTHSPDLLSCFDISDVAVMSRADDKPQVSWYRPEDWKTLVQMLKSVEGETLGDLHRSGELEALK